MDYIINICANPAERANTYLYGWMMLHKKQGMRAINIVQDFRERRPESFF